MALKEDSKLKSFEKTYILSLLQSYQNINHGVEKKTQMPVLNIWV